MKILFWDIDGTLLTTGRAGIFAWEDAMISMLGKKINFSELKTAGLTDGEIASDIIQNNGLEASTENISKLLSLYESYLPESLPKKTGRVLTNVKEILEALKDKPDFISLLLTGNTPTGAKVKLTYYGLDTYFKKGAFCQGALKRTRIAQNALALVRESHGEISLLDVYVIGDTPHDIQCGKAIGAKTIAVATGEYSSDELKQYGPWKDLDILPEPNVFLTYLID